MKLSDLLKSRCAKCPYTLGLVHFIKSPCPECKLNHYSVYYRLIKGRYGTMKAVKKDSFI